MLNHLYELTCKVMILVNMTADSADDTWEFSFWFMYIHLLKMYDLKVK